MIESLVLPPPGFSCRGVLLKSRCCFQQDHDTSGSSSATSYEDLPGSSSGGSCELEIAAFRSKTPPIEAGPDIDADACARSQSPPVQESSDLCYFCGQRVYLIDRLSAEGHFFHRLVFKLCYMSDISPDDGGDSDISDRGGNWNGD